MDTVRAEGLTDIRAELDRWRGLADHLPALVAFWDKDQRNMLANRAYVEWFGFTPLQLRGRHMRELLGERLYKKNLPYIQGALAGREQHFDRTLVSPTGQTRHSQADYIPEIVDGEVLGFHVLVTDTTAKVEAQRELDEAQALSHVGSFTWVPASGELAWSAETYRIAGKDPTTFAPSVAGWLALVHPDDLPRVQAARALGETGGAYEVSYRIVREDGEVRHVHSRTRPVLDDSGALKCLRGTLQDETELRRANAELASANGLLADTIGMLGHDLRQPLTVLRGYLEALREDWEQLDEPARRHLIEVGQRAANRTDDLLQDILALVNLDTASLVTHPDPELDVRAVLREALERSGCTAEVDLAGAPAVRADPVHLRQMLVNLLTNAARYGAPPITIRVHEEGDRVEVSVRDHGEGVPQEFLPELFDRFTRAGTGVAATMSGTGFGLYLVQRLAHANGGEVTHHSVRPHGAEFRLVLPRGR